MTETFFYGTTCHVNIALLNITMMGQLVTWRCGKKYSAFTLLIALTLTKKMRMSGTLLGDFPTDIEMLSHI